MESDRDTSIDSETDNLSVPISPILKYVHHIGACQDVQNHRQCVYNVLQTPQTPQTKPESESKVIITPSTTKHTPFDFEALKLKYSKSQRKLSRYKTKTRHLEMENHKLQDTSKQLRTMAGVIHEMKESAQQKLKQQLEEEAKNEKKVLTLQEKWESAKVKYERLQYDYDTLKKVKQRWVTPMTKSPRFVLEAPIKISVKQQLVEMKREIAELKRQNTKLTQVVVQLRNNRHLERQRIDTELNETKENMSAMTAQREMDKLEHFLEKQTCNSYKEWEQKQEMQRLRRENGKYEEKLEELRVLRVNERNHYEARLDKMRQIMVKLQRGEEGVDILEEIKMEHQEKEKSLELKCNLLNEALHAAQNKVDDAELREEIVVESMEKKVNRMMNEAVDQKE